MFLLQWLKFIEWSEETRSYLCMTMNGLKQPRTESGRQRGERGRERRKRERVRKRDVGATRQKEREERVAET